MRMYRIPTTAEMWQETFVSSVLRAIHQNEARLIGLRRVDPLGTEVMERRFLEAASKLFWNGWQLGAMNGQTTGTNVNNYLAMGVLKYFEEYQRPWLAMEFFEKFSNRDPEVANLIVKCLFSSDQESEGVKLMHDVLVSSTLHVASLLVTQCEFLMSKVKI